VTSTRDRLNQIWTQFRRVGITDDIVIIEHIAAILLEQEGLQSSAPGPRMPPSGTVNLDAVKTLLREAVDGVDKGAAELFDRYVLFRLPEMLPGGRYPTPRHVVQLMHCLCAIEPQHSLADLACGSGGLLVHRPTVKEVSGSPAGCEISPEWARIARANCALHVIPHDDIETGNALNICADEGRLAQRAFDRILMNPPFGQTVDARQARRVLGQPAGSRSETVLLSLALEKSSDHGRVCALVPSGLLSGASGAEQGLRERLVDQGWLEAVIRLPKDAFQPFSPLQTYLILERESLEDENAATWFMYAERDGYMSGRSRDLTQLPDLESSDFPLLEAVIRESEGDDRKAFPERLPLVHIRAIKREQRTLGIVVSALNGAELATVEHFVAQGIVLASVVHDQDNDPNRKSWVCIEPATGNVEETEGREDFLQELREREREAKEDEDELDENKFDSVLFHAQGDRAESLAIAADGRLIGALMPRRRIQGKGYNVNPDDYLRLELRKPEIETPAALLAKVRDNQRDLLERIDGLFSRLDLSPVSSTQLPPPVWMDNNAIPEPFGELSEEQRRVWRRVLEKTEPFEGVQGPYETPKLFTETDVGAGEEDGSSGMRSTLELLQCMGLAVLVTIKPENGEEVVRYRLPSERDRWA
jgi:type I restriction enzyme M protein